MTRCGNHEDRIYHANAAEVKACHLGLNTADLDRETGAVIRVAREMDPFDTDDQAGRGTAW